ncbi:MAG: alkaline phosphatase [Firmicutes bacterium]|nr:alkaline phosphatase [Bacillota bacterium]
MKISKKVTLLILIAVLILGIACSPSIRAEKAAGDKHQAIKNVIVFIGDGMGNQQRRIAGIVQGDGNPANRLSFEKFQAVGLATNQSADALVTDSAASATALSSGYKTNNHMLGVSPDGKKKPTILEACKKQGKSTGLITTVAITHATPAGFGAHEADRKKQLNIAPQYLENNIDVLLGGGKGEFTTKEMGGEREDGKNLIDAYKKAGYTLVENLTQLNEIKNGKSAKILGLFAMGDMDYEIDRNKSEQPSLAEMTETAINTLGKNPKGFFLMVEAGKVDWACHGNDVAGSVHDTLALDAAVKKALDFQKKHPETLIIVVNDHETGGLAITQQVNIRAIQQLKATTGKMAQMMKKDGSNIDEIFKTYAGITDLTTRERTVIADELSGKSKMEDEWGYGASIISKVVCKRTGINFATGGHTGTPVVLVAEGPGASIFSGQYDQTDIPKKIAQLLGIKFPF